MDLDFQSFILAIVGILGTFAIIFPFLRKVNEWYYVDRLGEQKKKHLPPGDMGWPVLGNTPSFLKAFRSQHPETFINNLVERYGKSGIYKTHMFGNPSIIICTPQECKKVLTDHQRFAHSMHRSLKELIDSKLQVDSASEHRRWRKLLGYPINSNEALSMYMGYIKDVVTTALEDWSSMNKPIEFSNEMEKITFKAFIRVFMLSTDESIIESMEKYNNDFINGVIYTALGIPGFSFRKAKKARNMLEKIFLQVLEDRRSTKSYRSDYINENKCMMDLLMEIEDDNGEKLSDKDICSLLLVFLAAGYKGVAELATWCIINLHNHPQLLQKAREEQNKILKIRPSTQKELNFEDIRQMEYTGQVIDETLRKISSFMLVREAIEDVDINGYFIPKGWKILVWLSSIHMNPEIYLNPKKFIPSRWENQNSKPGSFLPFGAGSNMCLGATYAKFVVSIFLHYFLLNYKLEQINPGGPIRNLPAPRPLDNCLAKVTKLS